MMEISVGGKVKRVGKGLTIESPWKHQHIWSLLGSLCSIKSLGMGSVSSHLNSFYTQGGLKKKFNLQEMPAEQNPPPQKKNMTKIKHTQAVQKEGREKHEGMEKG